MGPGPVADRTTTEAMVPLRTHRASGALSATPRAPLAGLGVMLTGGGGSVVDGGAALGVLEAHAAAATTRAARTGRSATERDRVDFTMHQFARR